MIFTGKEIGEAAGRAAGEEVGPTVAVQQVVEAAQKAACEAALALAAPVSLFQSSSSSPCALIRDPSSHSGAALRDFQRLPFPF